MRRIALTIAMAAALGAAGPARAERVVAVVHPTRQITEITVTELKNIYLGRKKSWPDGTPVRPFIRPDAHPAGFEFLRSIVKMTPARFKHHWQSLELSGQGTMPKVLATTSDVIDKIGANKGAISYVTEREAKTLSVQVRVVKIKY